MRRGYGEQPMEIPEVRHLTTPDGVRIAYWAAGAGPALVYMTPWPWSHVAEEWSQPEWVADYEYLSGFSKLVRFDPRGCGASGRDGVDLSLDARVSDLEAVIDAVEPGGTVSILASESSAHVAIAYAARHPERISHLVLTRCSALSADILPPRIEAMLPMIERDLEFYIDTVVSLLFGAQAQQRAAEAAALMRRCVTAGQAAAAVKSQLGLDVTNMLPAVKCETLLVAYTGEHLPPPESIMRLTWQIENSRFVVVDGTWLHSSEARQEIRDFLGAGYTPQVAAAGPSAFRTILFTDLVGHTEMMHRLGDASGREILRQHERITRDVLKLHDGSEVKTMGDGFMASFGSVTKAVECAVALQQAFNEWSRGSEETLCIRVGLEAGEPIEEEGDLFGAAVIMAARIAARAGANEILVSDVVRGLCSGKGFLFAEHGDFVPKGFEEPVRLFEISWQHYT